MSKEHIADRIYKTVNTLKNCWLPTLKGNPKEWLLLRWPFPFQLLLFSFVFHIFHRRYVKTTVEASQFEI